MSTTSELNLDEMTFGDKPGATLQALREKSGHTQEYVASKLHLRVRVIELLEADAYEEMPEPVFIKGYLRAYANLLETESAPLLEQFDYFYSDSATHVERALWQSRKPRNRTMHWVRLATGVFAIAVLGAAFLWWSKNKDIESLFSAHRQAADMSKLAQETDIRLTDLSNVRSLLSSTEELPPVRGKND